MSGHRKPPLPPHYETAPEGTCRWCNQEVGLTSKGKPSKSRWHTACLKDYKLLHWPTTTRRAVLRRDKAICAKCGVKCTYQLPWHMDHIKPLIESNGDISYWQLPNLQTLCENCHKEKTGKEATARAEKRKQDKAKKDEIQ